MEIRVGETIVRNNRSGNSGRIISVSNSFFEVRRLDNGAKARWIRRGCAVDAEAMKAAEAAEERLLEMVAGVPESVPGESGKPDFVAEAKEINDRNFADGASVESTALNFQPSDGHEQAAEGWYCAAPVTPPAKKGVNIHKGLVSAEGNMPVTTSLKVAGKFEKKHKDVLKAIRNLECSDDFGRRNFAPSSYRNEQNKEQPMYLMTRDGFMFLAMGFTGKPAALWKERFIDAFNRVEQIIRQREMQKVDRLTAKRVHETYLEVRRIGREVAALAGTGEASGPEAAFVNARCIVGTGYRIIKAELHDAYLIYCRENGLYPACRSLFFKRLYTFAVFLKPATITINRERWPALRGIALKKRQKGIDHAETTGAV